MTTSSLSKQYDPVQYLQTFDGDPQAYLASLRSGRDKVNAFMSAVNDNDQWILSVSDSQFKTPEAMVGYLLTFGSD